MNWLVSVVLSCNSESFYMYFDLQSLPTLHAKCWLYSWAMVIISDPRRFLNLKNLLHSATLDCNSHSIKTRKVILVCTSSLLASKKKRQNAHGQCQLNASRKEQRIQQTLIWKLSKSHKCCKNEKRMTKIKCHTDHFLPGGVQRPPETESKMVLEMWKTGNIRCSQAGRKQSILKVNQRSRAWSWRKWQPACPVSPGVCILTDAATAASVWTRV